jgi:hypothetical protein
MKKTLFEIGNDLAALYDQLEEAEGEITPELEAEMDALLAQGEEKIDGYCALIKEFEAKAKIRAEESTRISKLAQSDAAVASRLKTRLHEFLTRSDTQKIETLRFKVRRQKNGGRVPVILDEYFASHPEELPERYRKVVFTPDLEQIREDLLDEAADAQHWGAQDVATLAEPGEHLRIS